MNSTGSDLVYSTYLGGKGAGNELGQGIAVDPTGSASVVGITDALDFPVVNAVQPTSGGQLDAVAFRLTPSGTALSFSTYLGGSGSDYGQAVAVDTSGNTYATGLTASTNFPVANPYQPANAGPFDLFISVISDASFATPSPTVTVVSIPTGTSTPTSTAVVTATVTPVLTSTPTVTFTQVASATSTALPGTATGLPTSTATRTVTPCDMRFSDVRLQDYFFTPVQHLACHGAISG